MTTVTYVPADEPIQTGEYRGDPIMCFGFYKVRLDDGFTMLSAHTGFPRTVSEPPADLDAEPGFVEMLIREAERIRENAR